MVDCALMAPKITSYDDHDDDDCDILSVVDNGNVAEGGWRSTAAAAVCRGKSDGAGEELSEISGVDDEDDGQTKRTATSSGRKSQRASGLGAVIDSDAVKYLGAASEHFKKKMAEEIQHNKQVEQIENAKF